MRISNVSLVLAAGVAGGCLGSGSDQSAVNINAPVRGAVFTTLVDGSRVNQNIYNHKEDVYLDGGPGSKAPSTAAALAEGDYYFQVTDPSGQDLLSTDAIQCREFHVNQYGVISAVLGGCAHATGVDSDYASLGAITVQLMPYLDTTNMGGEYKVWVTPIGDYVAGGDSRFHGFLPQDSKTDNFKIRIVVAPPPGEEGYCGDGTLDAGEQCDDGNSENGDGCSANCTTETPPPICGDGHVDAGEQCDDGNLVSGDGCSNQCTTEELPPPCCGDGHLDAGEACDDGNLVNGDGCSSTCTIETPPCSCGDGHLDAGEACDDGNLVNGDGCSSTCTIEVTCPPPTPLEPGA